MSDPPPPYPGPGGPGYPPPHGAPYPDQTQGYSDKSGQYPPSAPPPPSYGAPPMAGYGPPPGQPGAFGPPAGQTGAFGPPPGQPGAYGPPSGQPGGYGPPPGQPGGYGPPPGQPGGYGPPPGQPGAYGAPTHTHSTVVVTQPRLTMVQTFRESPVHTSCPHCRAEIVTGIHYESGTLAWVACCILFWFGCVFGCCLLPFCVDGAKDVIHTCPNCRQQISRWSRM